MAKLLFVILLVFVVSTSVLFGENVCSNYDDEDCVHPNTTKNGYYTNRWAVYMPEISKDEAKKILEDNGFDYLGQIKDGLEIYLVTRINTVERHAMPDEKTIELLQEIEQVRSVVQKHVLDNSADEVFSIEDNSKVACQSLDPSTIQLNDGGDNLKRAQWKEDGEAVATMYTATRPASSSGSVDLYDGQPNNNNTLNGDTGAALMAGDNVLNYLKREDIEAAAALMAAVVAAASNAEAMASATAATDPLQSPSEMNQWALAGDGGPYYGDASDDDLALEKYLVNEYLLDNIRNQAENVSKSRSLGDVNLQRLSEDPLKADLLNGGLLLDELSGDATTVAGSMGNENRRPVF